MKVTIDFGHEIDEAIQLHLDSGISVQNVIRSATKFFMDMYKLEKKGHCIGYGNKDRFKQYNNEASPENYLNNQYLGD